MKAKTAPGELVRWLAAKRGISVEEASRALAELAALRSRLAEEPPAGG